MIIMTMFNFMVQIREDCLYYIMGSPFLPLTMTMVGWDVLQDTVQDGGIPTLYNVWLA